MFDNSKLSRYKVVECFCIDIDAAKTALLLKLNRIHAGLKFLVSKNKELMV